MDVNLEICMISSTSYALHLNYKVEVLPIPPIQRLFHPACSPNIKTQTCILFAKKEISKNWKRGS